MTRFLVLLLLTLLCTRGRAQIMDSIPMGSGSVTVDISAHERVIAVSSADYYKLYRYVSEAQYRRHPGEYGNYKPINFSGPDDLRMVHAIIDELLGMGWVMTETNHNLDIENNDDEDWQFGTYQKEKIYYQFNVPISSTPQAAPARVVVTAEVDESERGRLSGELIENTDGTFTLLLREFVGNRWLDLCRLTDTGPAITDKAKLIKALRLTDDYVEITVETEEGLYKYGFDKGHRGIFYFADLKFEGYTNCGFLNYKAGWKGNSAAYFKGKYALEPCTGDPRGKSFVAQVRLNQFQLQLFEPGNQSVMLESINKVVNF